MPSVKLIAKWWAWRTFSVTCDERTYTVKYHPWGWSEESVSVDDQVVARRSGMTMTHTFTFPLGEHTATLRIAVPGWAEIIPLSGLTFVRLTVDGQALYEEGLDPEETFYRPPMTEEE